MEYDDDYDDYDENEEPSRSDLNMQKQLGFLSLQMMKLNNTLNDDNDDELFDKSSVFQSMGQWDGDKEQALDVMRSYRDDVQGFYSKLDDVEVVAKLEDDSVFRPISNVSDISGDIQREDYGTEDSTIGDVIQLMRRYKDDKDSLETTKRRTLLAHFEELNNTIRSSSGGGDSFSGFATTLRSWSRDFTWMLSRFLFKNTLSLVKGIAGSVYSAALGKQGLLGLVGLGKDRSTVEEKILKAIKQQTEFFMTGKIDLGRGLFDKIKEFGLIGATLRGAGNIGLDAVGLGKERHQTNIIEKAAGLSKEEKTYNSKIANFISKTIYDDVSVKHGNISRIEAPQGNLFEVMSKQLGIITDIRDVMTTLSSTIERAVNATVGGASSPIGGGLHGDNSVNSKTSVSTIRELRDITELQREETRTYVAGSDRLTTSIITGDAAARRSTETNNQRTSLVDKVRYEETVSSREETNESLKDVIKYTEATAAETKKHRKQAFFQKIMGGVARIVSGIISIGASLVTMVGSLLGLGKLFRGKAGVGAVGAAGAAVAGASGGKLKAAIATIGAVGLALGRKGIVSGIVKVAEVGASVGKSVIQKGLKGSITGVVETIKNINKNDLKNAAIATAVGAAAIFRGAKGVVTETLSKRPKVAPTATSGGDTTGGVTGVGAATNGAATVSKPKTGGLKMAAGGIAANLALGAVVNNTDKDSRVGASARAAETAVDGYFTGSLIGGLVGGIAGAIKGGLIGAVPGAIAGGVAGMALGFKTGGAVGGVAGVGKGLYENREGIINGKPKTDSKLTDSKPDAFKSSSTNVDDLKADKTQDTRSPLMASLAAAGTSFAVGTNTILNSALSGAKDITGAAGAALGYKTGNIISQQPNDPSIKSPHHTRQSQDIDGSKKIKDASGRNDLWAKPTIEVEKNDSGLLKAIQETISMPVDYIKDLYADLTKSNAETVGKLVEGNEISKEVVKTLKEMSVKLDAVEGSPFASMGDPSLSGF